MPRYPPAWYDAQYNNRARIAEHPAILAHWADASARALATLHGELDLAYGDDASERLDLFPARATQAPVLVYIHGGYWRALDKRDQAFVAPPFVAAGAQVVLLNYALCPAVTIGDIVDQLRRALAWVQRHAVRYGGDPGRIVIAGHSAGGHLAAMLLDGDVACGALALSGVFELEPLRHAPFLAPDLKLGEADARALSPALRPAPRGPLFALVGAEESEEFLRQNRLIADAWGPAVVPVCESVPGRNHMDVLHELADPAARTHRLALQLLGM